VKENAGKTPVWNEMFNIDVRRISDDLSITVFDQEDWGADDLVGDSIIPLSQLCRVEDLALDEWFDINWKGKPSGKVHLKATWKPVIHYKSTRKLSIHKIRKEFTRVSARGAREETDPDKDESGNNSKRVSELSQDSSASSDDDSLLEESDLEDEIEKESDLLSKGNFNISL
jgi:hypothetical protein